MTFCVSMAEKGSRDLQRNDNPDPGRWGGLGNFISLKSAGELSTEKLWMVKKEKKKQKKKEKLLLLILKNWSRQTRPPQGIIFVKMLLEDFSGLLQGASFGFSKFAYELILMKPSASFHQSFGLRRVGINHPDAEFYHGPSKRGQRSFTGQFFFHGLVPVNPKHNMFVNVEGAWDSFLP